MRTIGKVLVLAMALSSVLAFSVAQSAQKPQFEVVSIKQAVFPNDAYFAGYSVAVSPCGRVRLRISGNRVTVGPISICGLIATAYDLRDYLISSSVASWLKNQDRSIYYEIQATATEVSVPLTPERASEMLQTLLADRFRLRVHRQVKDVSVYVLVVGKNGPRFMSNSKDPSAVPGLFDRCAIGIEATRAGLRSSCNLKGTMADLAERLSRETDRPVVDKTGIEGAHAFELHWANTGISTQSDAPALFTALQEQLGLKLEPVNESVQVLVIDSVQRPTEN